VNARRVNRAIGLGVLALAVVLALLPLVLERTSVPAHGSVDSPKDDGRQGLFLTLEELGFKPQRWNQPPGRLPHGAHVLWLAAAPEPWIQKVAKVDAAREDDEKSSDRAPEADTKPAGANATRIGSDATPIGPDATPPELALRALRQYRSFVEQGGTIVIGFSERAKHFLSDELHVDEVADVELDAKAPAGERVVHTAGDRLTVAWPAAATFRTPLDHVSDEDVLWTGERADAGEPDVLALKLSIGTGRLVLLADDRFLDNAHLRERDHALLAVRLAEELRTKGSALLFDESALGARKNTSAVELALSPRFVLVSAHLALLALLFVWARAWVSAFPRDPEPLARISPISRARARAALYERARRYDLLAAMLRRGAVRRWRAIAHVRGPSDGIGGIGGREASGTSDASGPSGSRSTSDGSRSSGAGDANGAGGKRDTSGTRDTSSGGARRLAAADLRNIVAELGAARELAPAGRPVFGAEDLEELARELDAVSADIAARARRPLASGR
jgi:hypothetical protein